MARRIRPTSPRRQSSTLDLGMAGEYLVCADLALAGYCAHRTEQHYRYDVILDHDGQLWRVQVKSTQAPKESNHKRTASTTPGKPGRPRKPLSCRYSFHCERGLPSHKDKTYKEGDFDICALVALDTRQVAYMIFDETPRLVHFRAEQFAPCTSGRAFEDFGIERALKLLNRRKRKR